jgi:exoribonuclease-2
MNVFYEEDGAFKAAAILADNNTSLQVEAARGKRSKIKASAVLLRFDAPGLAEFMPAAEKLAADMDTTFLWECCGEGEFGHETLARDYFGRPPQPLESAALVIALHAAPMYFYRKGKGRFRAAPKEALEAALAGAERRRQQQLTRDRYVETLAAGALPPEFQPLIDQLLYKPDRNGLEWKALELASTTQRCSPAHVLARCGGLASTHDYQLGKFLFEYFPRGAAFPDVPCDSQADDLPVADVEAYSIDDAETTEIDDAFSLTPGMDGGMRVGIHIAAPALGYPPGSPIDAIARDRLSTVYFPGSKVTMLPPGAISRYTLQPGDPVAAVSLYADIDAAGNVTGHETRVERVKIAENLRHDTLEPAFNAAAIMAGHVDHTHGDMLMRLYRWAAQLEVARLGGVPPPEQRAEYTFRVVDDRIAITRRGRGTPIDKLVAELMIHANSTWASDLAAAGIPAIYRVQTAGKVRMSTVPAPHEGLKVANYVWATSPLRRYVDLINQRQIITHASGTAPVYATGSEELLATMRDFDLAYDAYAEFQRNMERYWCLQWMVQEKRDLMTATVIRDNLVRFDVLPIVTRVPSVTGAAQGDRVELAISSIDLIDVSFHAEFVRAVTDTPPAETPESL